MADPTKRIIAISERLYRWLLGAYRQGGASGVLRLWLPTLGDLIANAIAEHFSTLIQLLRKCRTPITMGTVGRAW